MTKRAVIYCRISRDREGAGLGVQRQEQDCRELADQLGWTVVAVHTDNDLSAYSGKPRPGYKTLLSDLESGTANAVIVWHGDRLHRSPAELEDFIAICDKHKVAIQTVRAGNIDLTTPSGRMVARQLGSVARYEVEHMQERQRRAKAQVAAEGRFGGGRRPFGYEADGVTVRPSEAKALRWAAKRILAGASLNATARKLAADGITTSSGMPINPSTLRRAMMNPRYAGIRMHNGVEIGQAAWRPILDETTWRGVSALLSNEDRRTHNTHGQRIWLGTGLYLCGVCGATVRSSGQTSRTQHGKQTSYACRAGQHVVRQADLVDDVVRTTIAQRIAKVDLTPDDNADEIADLQAEALAKRERLDDLARLFADGTIDARQLAEGSARERAEQARLHDHITRLSRTDALGGIAGAADPGAAFMAADLDVQRSIVDSLATITILKVKPGRPAGWRPGSPYFDAASVKIDWKV